MGQLAALSTKPNKVAGTIFGVLVFDDNGPTYQSDANLIIILVSLQILFCLTNCFAMGYAHRPPANQVTVNTDRESITLNPDKSNSPEQPLRSDL